MTDSNRKYVIPYSGRRYLVNEDGEVLEIDGTVIPSRIVDGQKVVDLEWLFGKTTYYVGTLVLLANGHFRDFPEYLLDKIEPLFKDGDCSNTKISNVTYRFKDGPLESENYPGFFYVPFYTRYAISRDGEMITAEIGNYNCHQGVRRVWSIIPPNPTKGSPGGYRYVRAITDYGVSKILFRHQALCWTFKKYEANVRSLVCNHLNGIPGSDHLDNLELTTHRENNIHATRMGLRNGKKAITMLNLKTGETYRYFRVEDCLKHTEGLTVGIIKHRLTNPICKHRVYNDFWVFRREDDSTPFPSYEENVTKVYNTLKDRDTTARDIHTGEIFITSSAKQMGDLLGINSVVIQRRIYNEDPRPYKGYCFKHLDDKRGWPSFSERQLEIHRKYRRKERTPNGIIVIDLETNEELFFCSKDEAAEHFYISSITVFDLANGNKVFKKRFKFSFLDVHENVVWSHWSETTS